MYENPISNDIVEKTRQSWPPSLLLSAVAQLVVQDNEKAKRKK